MKRRHRLIPIVMLMFIVGVLSSGCTKSYDDNAQGKKEKDKNKDSALAKVDAKLEKIEVGELQKRVEAEKGNVVLVDFWSTT